jgi:soluble lytic murein transglycosylase-like protein
MIEENKMGRKCFMLLFFASLAPLASGAEPKPAAQLASTMRATMRTTVRVDRSSGRLIRTQLITPREVPPVEVIAQQPGNASGGTKPIAPKAANDRDAAKDREAVDKLVESAAQRHQVDPLLAKSVLAVESAYNQFATSPKGAMGYMQLMPGTAKQLGVTNAYDAQQNIEAGVRYLRYLKGKFQDERLVLAAYNAGEGAVQKHGWIPPYPETIEYVYKVGKRYGEARRSLTPSVPPVAPPETQSEPRMVQVVDAEGRIHLRMP